MKSFFSIQARQSNHGKHTAIVDPTGVVAAVIESPCWDPKNKLPLDRYNARLFAASQDMANVLQRTHDLLKAPAHNLQALIRIRVEIEQVLALLKETNEDATPSAPA